MNPEPPPAQYHDLLGQMLRGTDHPLHLPDPQLHALDKWCARAIEAVTFSHEVATGRASAEIMSDSMVTMNELSLSPEPQHRIFLLLVILNFNSNFRDYVGSETPYALFAPFLEYLSACFDTLVSGTRADGQRVQNPRHAQFCSLSQFVFHIRVWYETSGSLTTWRPS